MKTPTTTEEYLYAIQLKLAHLSVLIKYPLPVDVQPDCTNTHLIAHEPDLKELAYVFSAYPWCHFVSYRGVVNLSRKAFEAQLNKPDASTT